MQTRPPLTTSLLALSLGRVLPRRPPRPVRCNLPLPSPPPAFFITSLRRARVVASSSLSASSRRDYATTSKPKTPRLHKKATPAGPSTKRPEARAWRPSSLPEDVGVILSEGQQKVLELVLRGKVRCSAAPYVSRGTFCSSRIRLARLTSLWVQNVFLSGSAGTSALASLSSRAQKVLVKPRQARDGQTQSRTIRSYSLTPFQAPASPFSCARSSLSSERTDSSVHHTLP
jgi:hypothetical protein